MKLKTNNTPQKSANFKKNKSPKKQAKGVQVRKEKSKDIVKPKILKSEAEKNKIIETPQSPAKLLQQELWSKAIENVSNDSNLSDGESSVAKLLAGYKSKSSIPQKNIKFKNFITKGFSKFKETNDEVLDGVYNKILTEFKAVGGDAETINKRRVSATKKEKKDVKTKPNKDISDNEEMDIEGVEDEKDDDEVDDEDLDDEDLDDEDLDDEDIDDDEDLGSVNSDDSEEENPKPKGIKANNKNGKSQFNKRKNGSSFKGGKVQKNKKFGNKK